MVLTMPLVVQDNEEASLQAQDAASHTWLMDSEEDRQLYSFSCCMDESSRDRIAEATVFLQPLNSILEEANSNLSFEPLPTQGDGYCFVLRCSRRMQHGSFSNSSPSNVRLCA